MKDNTLLSVHNMLVEELENLMDIDLESDDPKKIESEMKRAEKVAKIGQAISANASVCVKGIKVSGIYGEKIPQALSMDVSPFDGSEQQKG